MRGLTLLFAMLVAGVVVGQVEPNSTPDPKRFERNIVEFEQWDRKNSFPQNSVLFVGSSSIVMWQTRKCFEGLPVINRGFGGSCLCDVDFYFKRVVSPYKPKVIVLYAGDNDLASGRSVQNVFEDFVRFVEMAHADMPRTRIIYISIKPSESRRSVWPAAQQANEMIRQFCQKDKRLYFVDAGSVLLNDAGRPNPDYFRDDKLHLNDRGYQRWTRLVRPVIDRALSH